jgi:hypothetical protein
MKTGGIVPPVSGPFVSLFGLTYHGPPGQYKQKGQTISTESIHRLLRLVLRVIDMTRR